MENSLIILDRDGVINKLLIRPDLNTDSPMCIEEIEIFPWVPEQIKILNDLQYKIAIATNQPSSAKGKISKSKLITIHDKIIENIILKNNIEIKSFICFHKKEDGCNCRKPKIGLLKEAFAFINNVDKQNSWMIGDRATDIIAGNNFGLNTALLGPSVLNDMDILQSLNIKPTYHGVDLRDFVQMIKRQDNIMEHFYQNIQGWFDFHRVYSKVIKDIPNNAHIVEVGAWKGRSTAYLAVEAINSGKNIKIDVIDTWKGSNDGSFAAYIDDLKQNNGDMFSVFKRNIEPVKHIINPIQISSQDAYKLYEDSSLDFIFFDGNHNYESIKNDIMLWRSKIKKGGYMGGHDYNHKDLPGVTKAVDEIFKNIIIIGGDGISSPSWLVCL